MKYGKFLEEGGTVGFVAPSFGCNIEPYRTGFEQAQKKLQKLGHNTWLGPNCYEGKGIGISNTPQLCGKELQEAYLSKESDVLISCGGGELMCEILDYVDFDRIKKADPKWYMGYSDNTNMTFLLTTLCDTASIYGPCAPAFGMNPWHPAIDDAYQVLTGKKHMLNGYDGWEKESLKDEEHPTEPYHITEEKVLHTYVGAEKAIRRIHLVPGILRSERYGDTSGSLADEACRLVPVCKRIFNRKTACVWTGNDGTGSVSCCHRSSKRL